MTNEQIWGDDNAANRLVSHLASAAQLAAMRAGGEFDPLDPFAPLVPTAPIQMELPRMAPDESLPKPNDPPVLPHHLADGSGRLQCGHKNCRGWLNRRYFERCPNCNRRVAKLVAKVERLKLPKLLTVQGELDRMMGLPYRDEGDS